MTRKLPNKTWDGPCHNRVTRVRRLARCWVAPPPTQISAPFYATTNPRWCSDLENSSSKVKTTDFVDTIMCE